MTVIIVGSDDGLHRWGGKVNCHQYHRHQLHHLPLLLHCSLCIFLGPGNIEKLIRGE